VPKVSSALGVVALLGALTLTTGSVAAGASGWASRTDTVHADSTLRWRPCGRGLECATLRVPRDPAQPDGSQIRLALTRVPAGQPEHRIGSLVVNFGGPGEDGRSGFGGWVQGLPTELRDRFDLVTFDPRGIGASRPLVQCLSRDEQRAYQEGRLPPKRFGARCAERAPKALLAHLGTTDVIEDLERIRVALGDEKLNYLGYSYGTLIGALYADRYPDRVRAMVLDGALDPGRSATDFAVDQVHALDAAVGAFLADCAGKPTCPLNEGRGGAAAAFARVFQRLQRSPLPAGDGDRLTISEAGFALYNALLLGERDGWPDLARALAAARDGDGAPLQELASMVVGTSQAAFSLDAHLAVTCADGRSAATDPGGLAELTARVAGASQNWPPDQWARPAQVCAAWPVSPSRTPVPVTAAGAPPILVIGSAGDAATPYVGAQALADQLESGVLLTVSGYKHTAFPSGDPCVDDAVTRYLIEVVPPPDGTTC
jgi:pimeloyl-ACP methyl ester carboxylesterase